jgi:hypothetical protein
MTVAVSALPDTVVGEFSPARMPLDAPHDLALSRRAAASVGYSRCPEDKLFGDEKEGTSEMLRLMGLPHVTRFPEVTVMRQDDCFQLLFHGGEYSRRVDVNLQYLEDADDLEGTELRLLARLQELGYEVERRSPLPPEGGAGN